MAIKTLQRTRVKICGIRDADFLRLAIELGVDACGLMFYEKSKRYISPEDAEKITQGIAPFSALVAVFVNPDETLVKEVIGKIPTAILQFHGDETEAFCNSFKRPYIKALRVQSEQDLRQQEKHYSSANALLLDSYDATQYGGTGHAFDWSIIPTQIEKPILLAGGLNVNNIKQAIDTVQPYGIDISSGVEDAPGKKSSQKLIEFMTHLHEVDAR